MRMFLLWPIKEYNMYAKAAPVAAPAVILPFTGGNTTLLVIASSMIALGVAVLVISVLIARKKNLTEIDFSEVK
jgi:hypothetical protein